MESRRLAYPDYEATNVVACQAETAPADHWIECDESVLSGLTQLWTENGRTYFGWL
jgi:hypothetical protein